MELQESFKKTSFTDDLPLKLSLVPYKVRPAYLLYPLFQAIYT